MENVNKQLLERWAAFGKAMQKAGSELPRHLIAETEQAIAAAEQAQQAEPVAWRVMIGDSNLFSYCETESDADFYGKQGGAKKIVKQPLYSKPPAVAVPDGLLTADDMKNLRRLAECCEDFESGGHDVPKAAMKRLELAGAVRSCGFGRHETTLFGDAMLAAAQKGGAA